MDMLWIGFSQGCSFMPFEKGAKDFQSGMTIYYAEAVTEINKPNPLSVCSCGDSFSNKIKCRNVTRYSKKFKNIKFLNGQHFDTARLSEDFYRVFWDVLTKKYPDQFKVGGGNVVFKTENSWGRVREEGVENLIKEVTAKIGTMYTFEVNEVSKEKTEHFPLPTSEKTNAEIEAWLRVGRNE